jgi:hypothetical protein
MLVFFEWWAPEATEVKMATTKDWGDGGLM